MSENEAANAANANADFGRDQRRANAPEGRRPVEARDRAPEVYVEGEQVARLVDNRPAAVDAPAVSWFADDVAPGDSPSAVLTAIRTAINEAPGVDTSAPTGAPSPTTNAGPGRAFGADETPGDARPLDEFDVVLRGLDRADSPLNMAFPRLGTEDRSFFDPDAFSGITAPADPVMMRPAVEPRTEDTTLDLSRDGGQAQPGFGRPEETTRMTPAVEPVSGDDSFRGPSVEDSGSGLRPMDESKDDGARVPGEPGPDRGLHTDKDGAEAGIPSRTTDVPDPARAADLATPTRPGLEDLVASGRRDFQTETATEPTAPVSRSETGTFASRPGPETAPARAVDPPASSDSLDVFATRPMAPTPAPALEATGRSTPPVPEPARAATDFAPPAAESIPSPVTGSGILPGRGFFDDTPAGDVKDAAPREPIVGRDVRDSARSEDADSRIPVEDPLLARFAQPEFASDDDLQPLSFDDDDSLDNE